MDYYELQKMPCGDLAMHIEDACYNTIDEIELSGDIQDATAFLDGTYGHTELHAGKSIGEIFNDMTEKQKKANGTFINSEAAYRHVLDVIAYNSAEIASWLQKSHLDKMEYGETYNRFTCELNMHEKIGTVYTMNGEEYDSSGITLTLERNKTGTSPLGFSLVTAYPNTIYAEKTGNKVDLELLAL